MPFSCVESSKMLIKEEVVAHQFSISQKFKLYADQREIGEKHMCSNRKWKKYIKDILKSKICHNQA